MRLGRCTCEPSLVQLDEFHEVLDEVPQCVHRPLDGLGRTTLGQKPVPEEAPVALRRPQAMHDDVPLREDLHCMVQDRHEAGPFGIL